MSLAERCSNLPVGARRIIALVAVPAAFILMLSALGLPALYLQQSQHEWRDEAQGVLSRSKQAPDLQQMLEREIAALQTSALWSKLYVSRSTAPDATALHADIGALLSSAQAVAQSLTPIPSEQRPPLLRIGVRVTASLRTNQLQSLMIAMNQHARYLRIERMTIIAPQVQTAQDNPPLAVTMDVYGYATQATAAGMTSETSVALRGRS